MRIANVGVGVGVDSTAGLTRTVMVALVDNRPSLTENSNESVPT